MKRNHKTKVTLEGIEILTAAELQELMSQVQDMQARLYNRYENFLEIVQRNVPKIDFLIDGIAKKERLKILAHMVEGGYFDVLDLLLQTMQEQYEEIQRLGDQISAQGHRQYVLSDSGSAQAIQRLLEVFEGLVLEITAIRSTFDNISEEVFNILAEIQERPKAIQSAVNKEEASYPKMTEFYRWSRYQLNEEMIENQTDQVMTRLQDAINLLKEYEENRAWLDQQDLRQGQLEQKLSEIRSQMAELKTKRLHLEEKLRCWEDLLDRADLDPWAERKLDREAELDPKSERLTEELLREKAEPIEIPSPRIEIVKLFRDSIEDVEQRLKSLRYIPTETVTAEEDQLRKLLVCTLSLVVDRRVKGKTIKKTAEILSDSGYLNPKEQETIEDIASKMAQEGQLVEINQWGRYKISLYNLTPLGKRKAVEWIKEFPPEFMSKIEQAKIRSKPDK